MIEANNFGIFSGVGEREYFVELQNFCTHSYLPQTDFDGNLGHLGET